MTDYEDGEEADEVYAAECTIANLRQELRKLHADLVGKSEHEKSVESMREAMYQAASIERDKLVKDLERAQRLQEEAQTSAKLLQVENARLIDVVADLSRRIQVIGKALKGEIAAT